jgi:hypothetical protein
LQTFKIDGWGNTIPLMTGFGGQRFSHLTQLSLDTIFDLNLFLRFLTQCPRLQGLSARQFSRDGLASFSGHIHPETIPLLRSINAPLDLVLALTPNRPVCDVIVRVIVRAGYSFFPDIPPEVLDISNASVPVRSLALPTTYPTLESLNTMLSLFPELTSLSMEIDCEEHPRFRCGGRRGRMGKPWTPEIDTRIPVIDDAGAFDLLPPEEVSDGEEEQPSPAIHVASETHSKITDTIRLHVCMQLGL